jgi:NAD(P)H-hydrate epimerase
MGNVQAIVTPEQMAAIDAAAPEPVDVLIERAGAAVARAALDLLGGAYGRRVVVLAGKGNNGADGRAAARRLRARGVGVQVIDASAAPEVIGRCDLVIDAAYGTGMRGRYRAPALPDPSPPVLAVDIPSGLSGRTGAASERVLPATRTVTFAAWKPGLLLGDGPGLAGEVHVADIGLDVSAATAHLLDAEAVAAWLPRRGREAHKWQRAVWLVAGSPGMTGAARLAAASALRGGAGYVRLSTPGAGVEVDAPTEAVVVPVPERGWSAEVTTDAGRFGAVAVGPGLGRAPHHAEEVAAVLAGVAAPVIIDGDGLHALALAGFDATRARPDDAPAVLTPHDGEYAALAGERPSDDRFAAARDLAATSGAVVLLKGPTTIVAHPDGRVLVVTSGDERLATAGSGDVLTGLIAALAADGIDPFRAAGAAAFLHGVAGGLALRRGLVASDLVAHLPAALTNVAGG